MPESNSSSKNQSRIEGSDVRIGGNQVTGNNNQTIHNSTDNSQHYYIDFSKNYRLRVGTVVVFVFLPVLAFLYFNGYFKPTGNPGSTEGTTTVSTLPEGDSPAYQQEASTTPVVPKNNIPVANDPKPVPNRVLLVVDSEESTLKNVAHSALATEFTNNGWQIATQSNEALRARVELIVESNVKEVPKLRTLYLPDFVVHIKLLRLPKKIYDYQKSFIYSEEPGYTTKLLKSEEEVSLTFNKWLKKILRKEDLIQKIKS